LQVSHTMLSMSTCEHTLHWQYLLALDDHNSAVWRPIKQEWLTSRKCDRVVILEYHLHNLHNPTLTAARQLSKLSCSQPIVAAKFCMA
jgi:hypothetical protein